MGRSHPVTRSPDRPGSETSSGIIRSNQASSGHRPGIVRASSGHRPGIFGYEMIIACRIVCRRSHRPVGPVACAMTCRRIACRQACRVRYRPSPDRVPSRSSRAVSPVVGHGVGDGCRVPYGLVPDCVPYRPSPDHVSSYPGSYRRPLSPCRDHRLACRTPVICHAPAQHTPVADAANRCVACGFTCQYRGVLSTPVRRRG